MKHLERWMFTRPYSVAVFAFFGFMTGLLGNIWMPLALVPVSLMLGLLVYFAFFSPKM